MASQSDYTPFQYEFRERNKEKEIQKNPLRFNFIPRGINKDDKFYMNSRRFRSRVKNINQPKKP